MCDATQIVMAKVINYSTCCACLQLSNIVFTYKELFYEHMQGARSLSLSLHIKSIIRCFLSPDYCNSFPLEISSNFIGLLNKVIELFIGFLSGKYLTKYACPT